MPSLKNNDAIQELHKIVLQYFAEEKWQEAYTACVTITQIYPDFPLAYQTLGQICQKLQKLDEAIEWHEQAITLDPNLVEAQANLGSIYNYQQQWQKAIARCEKALALDPDFQPVRRILIHAYHKISPTVDIAQRQYELWQVTPTYFTTQEILNLGKRLGDLQKNDCANTCYEYLTANNPDFSPIPYENLITFYQNKKDWQKTEYFYRQLIKNFPDSPDLATIDQTIGQLFLQQEKWSEAQDCFLRAIALQPDLSNSHHSLGDIFCREAKYDLALHHYETAIKLAPDNWLVYHRMADIYKTQGDLHRANNNSLYCQAQYDLALQHYKTAIKLAPDNSLNWLFYHRMGNIYKAQGDLHRAITHYQKAIELNPEPAEFIWSTNALGMTYVGVGQQLESEEKHQEAYTYYLKAIKLNPEYPWFIYFNELVGYFHKHQQLVSIKEMYEKMIEDKPESIWAFSNLADIYTIEGNMEKAIPYYQIACKHKTQLDYPEFIDKYWDQAIGHGPDFIIIGAQKSGTTSLESYIAEHPQVIKALKKEVHFWGWHFERGIDWYLAHFPQILPNSGYITGEATPNYLEQLANLNSIQRIHDNFPHVKLLVVLRNPIDRAFSQYNHWSSFHWEKRSFMQVVDEELALLEKNPDIPQGNQQYWSNTVSYLGRGVYIEFLKKWLEFFPREQILILGAESFYQQTTKTLETVWQFLNLPSYRLNNYHKRNAGFYSQKIPPEIRSKLHKYFAPHNTRLEEFLGQKFDWQG